jgi:hypothetical protein
MSLASPNSSLNRGPHLAEVVAVVLFPPAYFCHDSGIHFGPQVVCDNALVVDVIPFQNASLFQFVKCGNNLLKSAIDDTPSLVDIGFYLFQFCFAGFHNLCPIGHHVSQRIQAFSGDGKRRYLHSTWQEIEETQETEGLDSGLHGRAYRLRKIAHFQLGNRKERSGFARSGNPGRQLWDVSATTLKQTLGGEAFVGDNYDVALAMNDWISLSEMPAWRSELITKSSSSRSALDTKIT